MSYDLCLTQPDQNLNKALNNGPECAGLFLSMTALFPARRIISEHKRQSNAPTFF